MNYEDVGRRLRCLRQAAGLTQQQVADALGVTNSAISLMESGKVQAPVHRLEAYAVAVGGAIRVAVLDGEADALVERVAAIVDHLPQRDRRALEALLGAWEADHMAGTRAS